MGKRSPLLHIPSKNPLRCAAIDNLQLSVPSGGAWGLGQLRPRGAADWETRVQDPGAPRLPLVGGSVGTSPEAGTGAGGGAPWWESKKTPFFQSCRERGTR